LEKNTSRTVGVINDKTLLMWYMHGKRLSQHTPLSVQQANGVQYMSSSGSKPRTTDLCPWLWGTALTGRSEHSSPHLRTGRSVVRGKLLAQGLDQTQ